MSQIQVAKLQPLKRETLRLKFDLPLALSLIAIHGNLLFNIYLFLLFPLLQEIQSLPLHQSMFRENAIVAGKWAAVTTKPSKIVRGQVIRTIGINL